MFNFDVILMANIICFSMVLVELALKSLLSAFILLTMKTLNVTNYNCVSVYSCCWFSLCGNGKSWCRYQSGDRLSPEHERTVVERLLPFHPEFEKKIGSGINYITVSLSLSLSCSQFPWQNARFNFKSISTILSNSLCTMCTKMMLSDLSDENFELILLIKNLFLS